MDVLVDIFDVAVGTGETLVCESLLNTFPTLKTMRCVHRVSRYSRVLKNCRTIRSSISYRYKWVANKGRVPTKPKMHFEDVRCGCTEYKKAMQTHATRFTFPTIGRDIEVYSRFSLRGWRWKLMHTVELNGQRHVVWIREKRAPHLFAPRLGYHNSVMACGCSLHHPVHLACASCGEEDLSTTTSLAGVFGVDPIMVSTVYRLTRCHHVGAGVNQLALIYFTVPDEVQNWDQVSDRPGPTPSLTRFYSVQNPQVLPCIKHLTIAADIPYYATARLQRPLPPVSTATS